jgi:HK97 family phage major capsid protein
MKTVKELRHDLGSLHDKMLAIQKKADDEKRRMSGEEEATWNQIDADYNETRKDILRREQMETRQAELEGRVNVPPAEVRTSPNGAEPAMSTEERKEKEQVAFRNWIRQGFEGLNQEQRAIMSRRRVTNDGSLLPAEVRAQSTTTTAGGYLIPQGFSELLDKALKAYGGMRQAARVFPTPDGRDIPWPTVDDTANVGEIISENSTHNNQDVAFGQITLKAYKYSSKMVPVSVELLQDSFFDVEALLAELLAERMGRILNTHFTTGTGTGQPKGVVVEAGLGKAGLTGQTTSVIYADLVDLLHSVDPAYREGSTFMFADSTLKAIKKLVDGSSRPLWQPALNGIAGAAPDTILGYPYVINQDVAAMGVSAKSILFGNFKKYIIRDARDITVVRLVERYAELGQVAFLAFSRHDGRAINAAALKYYQNSAT